MHASLTIGSGGVEFRCSYDAALVEALKTRVPADARRWNNTQKAWHVQAEYARTCAELAQVHLGIACDVPRQVPAGRAETRMIELLYLARCKQRGNESSALGWSQGDWTVVVPEPVLREWFESEPRRRGAAPTLYAALGVPPGADADAISSAHRRMARQWHPDVCREEGAVEQFKRIQHAYEVLRNPRTRRKYDAGLALAQDSAQGDITDAGYRAPLRCGVVLADGRETLGRFVVERILQWEDLTNERGQIGISSWPVNAKTFELIWR